MHLRDVLGEELFARNAGYVERVLAGERQTFERIIHDAGGALRYTEVSYVPDIVEGQVLGFFAMGTDLTEHTETQMGLRAALADLEQFSGVAAHDLRNPLIGIGGYADLPALTWPEVRDSA